MIVTVAINITDSSSGIDKVIVAAGETAKVVGVDPDTSSIEAMRLISELVERNKAKAISQVERYRELGAEADRAA